MQSALEAVLGEAIAKRRGARYSRYALPSSAPDLFSNDYLSLDTDAALHRGLVEELAKSERTLGSGGSRSAGGTTPHHVSLEDFFREKYGAPAAMVFNSGYHANTALLSSLPQPGDVLIHDELIHASCHHGMALSRAKDDIFSFDHNSVDSLDRIITVVLDRYPGIILETSTIFFVLESLYSMDGHYAPLQDIVELIERRVPRGAAHILVDEAHTHGIVGPKGMGLVAHLGLGKRIHSTMLSFTKGHNFMGAVVLTSPVICDYMVNYAKPLVYTTALPHADLTGMQYCFEVVASTKGDERRRKLMSNAMFFDETLSSALRDIPGHILSFPRTASRYVQAGPKSDRDRDVGITSPIFPILSPQAGSLKAFLRARGYAAVVIAFPIVPEGLDRLRVVIHAGNTREEIVEFVRLLRQWAMAVCSSENGVAARPADEITFGERDANYVHARAKL